ncbi:DUF2314 domain-containing protein [Qipengyuania sp. 1XM1-15A]|uniref:DUF2314 domain-containing protein n=1 Tax=Qipengyuania xiamenensis TaxID=2867237 RepID=UPI001C87B144|nr:DUF2314 domain-containing protein [Qipengyuania xiamenensis]MBX7532752.1 DUF2314 domain-containing protein [Qipengyuania xiamenensis]
MIRAASLAAALLLAPVSLSAQDAEGDPIMEFESVDEQMNAAIAEAQASAPRFLALLDNPPAGASNFVFKFPLEGYEHIWVGSVERDGDYLTGRLKNNPHAEGWKLGDVVRVPVTAISDWGYVDRTGVAQGYYTVRVMIDHMEPAMAAEVRRQYGWAD